MNTEELIAQLKLKAEEIVKRGGDVRADTSRLVSEASETFYQAKGGLIALVKAVTDGAVAGASQAVPGEAEGVLRSVVNGVTDGLTKSAQAISLAIEESGAKGTRFANEDLAKIAADFKTLREMIVDIISGSASAMGGHVKDQAHTLGQHARQTLQAAWPALESVIHAAQHDPVKLGKETVHAGAAAARQAAGVLFSELGHYLQKAGQKLRE